MFPPLRSAVQTQDSMWEIWQLITDTRQFTVQNLDLDLSWYNLYSVLSTTLNPNKPIQLAVFNLIF